MYLHSTLVTRRRFVDQYEEKKKHRSVCDDISQDDESQGI